MTELEFHDDFKPLVQLANVNPMLRPIDVEDLSGLPPGMILVAEIDVLFDGQQAYAQRLREAGVDIEFVVGEGMPHVFTSFASPDAICERLFSAGLRCYEQSVESLIQRRRNHAIRSCCHPGSFGV